MTPYLSDHEERRSRVDRRTSDEGRDWRPTVMNALSMVLFAIVGWLATTSYNESSKLREQVNANTQGLAVQRAESAQSIAVMRSELMYEIAMVRVEGKENTKQLERIETLLKRMR